MITARRLSPHWGDNSREFGRGFGEKTLRRMIQFPEVPPVRGIVASLMRELTWSHFTALIPLDQPLQRKFYAEV